VSKPSFLDPHIPDASGSFAADADTCEVAATQNAAGDQNIFSRLSDTGAIHAPARFKTDGVAAGIDIAAFNEHIFAGIHSNAVACIANIQIPYHHIVAVGRMRGPSTVVCNGKIFPAKAGTGNGFENRGAVTIERLRPGYDISILL
jgi:hypothetical protein